MDKVCFIRSMNTDQFNHAPAQFLMQTGYAAHWLRERGCVGDLRPRHGKPEPARLHRAPERRAHGGRRQERVERGFLPGVYQGVQCRSDGDPVLYLANPPGIDRKLRGSVVEAIEKLNRETHAQNRRSRNPRAHRAVRTRLPHANERHGCLRFEAGAARDARSSTAPSRASESFANNCLLARRLVERGVRFVQLYRLGLGQPRRRSERRPARRLRQEVPIHRPADRRAADRPRSSAVCSTKRSSSGAANSAARRWRRTAAAWTSVFGRDHHPQAFTDLDGRRRRQTRPQHRPDRRVRLQRRRESRASAGSPRDDASLARPRSHQTYLSCSRRSQPAPDECDQGSEEW